MKYARVVVLCGLAAAASAPEPTEITLKTASYDELGRLIRGLRGKVVVVDFWAHY
jgi:hypothetical protein